VAALNPIDLDATVTVEGLPMTRDVFHRLAAEAERLADRLPGSPPPGHAAARAGPGPCGQAGWVVIVGSCVRIWPYSIQ
jgi:hypothetical protein